MKWIDKQRAQKDLYDSKLYWTLSYFRFSSTRCISISLFASLVGIPIGIRSSATGLKICAIIPAIKKYKVIIKTKEKKHDKIVLLAKSKLNSIGVLISKDLIDLDISHD